MKKNEWFSTSGNSYGIITSSILQKFNITNIQQLFETIKQITNNKPHYLCKRK
ncbi:hypothetical protein PRABACTJOHN_03729 [Parabacteroides johnsonii DSM 18315]|uniref:Uncharacterized protein n=1 Tax=Parabacteroides johnsonii DSM 18315 TaxID=537006 RepID=B7BFA1_9BACT|nr:hypothetical protein PRABACTJOHN_03729 [Parabacteroides johnsonii DSM 18315]